MIALLSALTLQAQNIEKQIRKGNRQYRKGNYAEAEVQYRKVLEDNPNSIEAQFNLGDALYKQKNYKDAFDVFQKATEQTPDSKLKSKAEFNMGNCLLEQGKTYEAFNVYKTALKDDPGNEDALYNLEYCRALLVKSRVMVNPQIPHGTVTAKPQEAYNGQIIALKAQPDEEYVFWQYSVTKADDQQVTVDESDGKFEMPKFDVMVNAEFRLLHKITVNKNIKHGTISAGRQKAAEGQQVTLQAQPEPNYIVDHYRVYKTGSPNDTVKVNESSFQMPDFDVTVTAEFRNALRITVDTATNGKVSVSDSLALVGKTINIIVKPDQGYQLGELRVVSDKDSLVTAPVNDMNQFQMLDTDVTVKASFVEAQEYYKVVADTAIEGGSVKVDVDKATRGETVDLKNTPEEGYKLKEYKIYQEGDTTVTVQPQGNFFTMPAMNVTVSAVFEPEDGQNQEQQQQQQQQQEEQEQEQEQQQQQQESQEISKEDAQQMLDALEEKEKKTMQKFNEQKVKTQPKRQTDKDW